MARLKLCFALIIAMSVLICVLAEEELYSDRYDNIDVAAAFQNKTIRHSYYNCFMKIAPCQSPQQETLTGIFSEAYQTKCKRCTEKQKEIFASVAEWYEKNEPDNWRLIVTKIIEDIKKKNANQ